MTGYFPPPDFTPRPWMNSSPLAFAWGGKSWRDQPAAQGLLSDYLANRPAQMNAYNSGAVGGLAPGVPTGPTFNVIAAADLAKTLNPQQLQTLGMLQTGQARQAQSTIDALNQLGHAYSAAAARGGMAGIWQAGGTPEFAAYRNLLTQMGNPAATMQNLGLQPSDYWNQLNPDAQNLPLLMQARRTTGAA